MRTLPAIVLVLLTQALASSVVRAGENATMFRPGSLTADIDAALAEVEVLPLPEAKPQPAPAQPVAAQPVPTQPVPQQQVPLSQRAVTISPQPRIMHANTSPAPQLGHRAVLSGTINALAFQQALNRYRVSQGRNPVQYNPALDAIAARNNTEQRRLGRCGHHYTQGIAQNAATGSRGIAALMRSWSKSPGHNRLLLDTTATEFGIHSDGWASTLVMPSRVLGFPSGHDQHQSQPRRGWRWRR